MVRSRFVRHSLILFVSLFVIAAGMFVQVSGSRRV